MGDKDYSATPLATKLGAKPGAEVLVFFTTSRFTQGAHDYAAGISSRVILIDGARLADLMIKYGIGVQTKQAYAVVEVDEDYFE